MDFYRIYGGCPITMTVDFSVKMLVDFITNSGGFLVDFWWVSLPFFVDFMVGFITKSPKVVDFRNPVSRRVLSKDKSFGLTYQIQVFFTVVG